MDKAQEKRMRKDRRHRRIRAKVFGTKERPRLSVYKSARAVYAQIINDDEGVTLASADSRKIKGKTPEERAHETGIAIAKAGALKKITSVVFDRGGYEYKGKIKTVAEGARKGGLTF